MPETAAHLATDRPTWRRLVEEKSERIRVFERDILGRLLAGVRPRGRVLEIGCGLGWAAAVIASHRPDLHVTAVDLVEPYLAQHTARVATFFGVTMNLVAADAVRLPFDAESFDRVFSQMVLYRVDSPPLAIRQAHRVLVRGGRWLAIERAAPWCWPWSAREVRHFERRNRETGLCERAYTARDWREFFWLALGVAWVRRPSWRSHANALRAEHLLVEIEKL